MGLVFDTCRSLAGDGPRAVLEFPFFGVRGADNKRIHNNTPITFNIP